MRFVACALLLFVAACAGQGGEEASEGAATDTPSMSTTDTTTMSDTTMRDTTTADTSMARDTAR
jgi:hypothetical protein